MLQLNPPIPMYIPEQDIEGWAHFIIDYGPESYVYFVILTDKGEWWTYDNTKVKGCINKTMNRYEKNRD